MKKLFFLTLVSLCLFSASCSNYDEESVFSDKLDGQSTAADTGEQEDDDMVIEPPSLD